MTNRIIKFRVYQSVLGMSFPTSDAWFQLKDGEIELPKDTVIMQFTGLLDKNGKEIYEGDITARGIITFSRGKFQGTYYDSNGNLEEDWEDDLYSEKNIEIIGNIYEHPNLLK